MPLFGRAKQKDPVCPTEATNLYLDLMIRSLKNAIYDDDADMATGKYVVDEATGKYVLLESAPADAEQKYAGGIWPSRAHTMIGVPRLINIKQCVEEVLIKGVPGDLIETGVWRGGASIFMRAILKVHGVTDRNVWVADSFEGLPEPDLENFPQDGKFELHKYEVLAVSLKEVTSNFQRYGLLDDQVRFLKGWFKDTLPEAPIERLAVMRLDGDLYESTMDALINLYPKLSVGGYVIIDDYGALDVCNQAVDEFREQRGIDDELKTIPGCGVYWQRKGER